MVKSNEKRLKHREHREQESDDDFVVHQKAAKRSKKYVVESESEEEVQHAKPSKAIHVKKSPVKKKLKNEGDIEWKNFYGFKCYFTDLIKQGKSVMSGFDDYCMDVLKHTPFYHFFWAINEGRLTETMVEKCCNSIYHLLNMYRHDLKGFVLNKSQPKGVRLSPRLTSLIFGISMKGNKLESVEHEYIEECDMYSKFFNGKKTVSRREIRAAMEELQRGQELSNGDKVNLVKLMIMYSFSALFFSSTSSIVSKSMMAKFDSITTLNQVCWPNEITQRLYEQIVKYRSKPKSVSGCVYLILYILVEHANVIDPLKSEEAVFPRMLKWDLSKVTSDNWGVIQKNLLKAEVKVEIDNMSWLEMKLLEGEKELSKVEDSEEEEGDSNKNPLHDLCDAVFIDEGGIHGDVDKIDKESGDKEKKKARKEKRKEDKKIKEKKEKEIEQDVGHKKKKMKEKEIKSPKKVVFVESEDVAKGVESSKEIRVVDHLMKDFPNVPLLDELEELYGTDVYMENLTDNVDDLKHLIRREKTIIDQLKLKCDYLEKLLKLREVENSDNEEKKLKDEIVLLEETYKEALKLYNIESVRSDLSLQGLIVKADKIEKMYRQVVDELEKERAEHKLGIDEAGARIKDQANTIKSCREREN